MSTALEKLFEKTKQEKRAALIGYLPAGYPDQKSSAKIIKAMIDGGVDAIEIGFPYSDPVMDGPVIQAASEEAIKNGAGVDEVFDLLQTTAALGTPSVIMSYWSPIEKYGVAKFAQEVSNAKGSGVITPDLTVEESDSWRVESDKNGLNRIYVVAPSTTDSRLPQVTSRCSGFVYAASLMGVTGTRTSVSSDASNLVSRVRSVTELPISVGLGVSTREQAKSLAAYADGVIVGSAFIKLLLDAKSEQEGLDAISHLARELALGVREGR